MLWRQISAVAIDHRWVCLRCIRAYGMCVGVRTNECVCLAYVFAPFSFSFFSSLSLCCSLFGRPRSAKASQRHYSLNLCFFFNSRSLVTELCKHLDARVWVIWTQFPFIRDRMADKLQLIPGWHVSQSWRSDCLRDASEPKFPNDGCSIEVQFN